MSRSCRWPLRRRVSEHTLARPQRPDFHHLLTLTSGDLWDVVDFNGYALRPGSWLWLRPGQVHQWGDLTKAEGTLILFQQDVLDPATATAARVDDPHAPVLTTPVAADAEAVTMGTFGRVGGAEQLKCPSVAGAASRTVIAACSPRPPTAVRPSTSHWSPG